MSDIAGSVTAFVEPGVYQRLACGCVMHAHEIDPRGPCLCLVYRRGECVAPHAVADFLPLRVSAAQAVAMGSAA